VSDNVERIAFTLREVAQMVGRSESTVRRAVKDRRLRGRYVSEHPVFTRQDIDAWLDSAPSERESA